MPKTRCPGRNPHYSLTSVRTRRLQTTFASRRDFSLRQRQSIAPVYRPALRETNKCSPSSNRLIIILISLMFHIYIYIYIYIKYSRCRKIAINVSASQIARIESVYIELNDTMVRQPLQTILCVHLTIVFALTLFAVGQLTLFY